jgi:hypothetical protein
MSLSFFSAALKTVSAFGMGNFIRLKLDHALKGVMPDEVERIIVTYGAVILSGGLFHIAGERSGVYGVSKGELITPDTMIYVACTILGSLLADIQLKAHANHGDNASDYTPPTNKV